MLSRSRQYAHPSYLHDHRKITPELHPHPPPHVPGRELCHSRSGSRQPLPSHWSCLATTLTAIAAPPPTPNTHKAHLQLRAPRRHRPPEHLAQVDGGDLLGAPVQLQKASHSRSTQHTETNTGRSQMRKQRCTSPMEEQAKLQDKACGGEDEKAARCSVQSTSHGAQSTQGKNKLTQ